MAVTTNRASDGHRFKVVGSVAPVHRLVVNAVAMDKCGKTRFALTAPGPIGFFNFNRGLEGVYEQFVGQKELRVANYRVPKSERNAQSMSEQIWDEFVADWLHFLDSDMRTGVIDSGTETWELIRLAKLGKLEGAGKARNYGVVNLEYSELLNRIYDTDKNLIITHKMKAEYVNDTRTGKMEAAGYNDMRSLVQVNVDLWYQNEAEAGKRAMDTGTDQEVGFHMTVRNCRQNYKVVGDVLTNDLIDFPTLGMMVFPESDVSVWV